MAGVLATPVKRCPPGLNCGVGPECTVYDCDVEDCASAPICQKRGLASLSKRCPPGLFCGVGPECTVDDCSVEDCASAPVCQKRGLELADEKVKRDPTPVDQKICPQICNVEGVCGCALESSTASPSMIKRDPTPVDQIVCPDHCDTDDNCGCPKIPVVTMKP